MNAGAGRGGGLTTKNSERSTPPLQTPLTFVPNMPHPSPSTSTALLLQSRAGFFVASKPSLA